MPYFIADLNDYIDFPKKEVIFFTVCFTLLENMISNIGSGRAEIPKTITNPDFS